MSKQFKYMVEFGLLKNAAIAGGAGLAYGLGYTGAKYLRGDLKDPDAVASEAVSNTTGGVVSGISGAALSRAMRVL